MFEFNALTDLSRQSRGFYQQYTKLLYEFDKAYHERKVKGRIQAKLNNEAMKYITALEESPDDNDNYDRIMPLEAALKEQLERAFGTDLSDVKIHIGPYAESLTRRAGAYAVTMGKDIYFSGGRFSPDTEEGLRLLIHEIEHASIDHKTTRMVYLEDIEDLEYEAEKAEAISGNMRLHNVKNPYLSKDNNLFFEDDAIDTESSGNRGTLNSLDDFASRRDKPAYRIKLKDGKVCYITGSQLKQVYEKAETEIHEYINEKIQTAMEKEKQEIIVKYIDFINNAE